MRRYFDTYEIELTSDCNASCPLCKRTELELPNYGNSNLTINDIKRILPPELCKDRWISLSGVLGDPIVNSDCLEICEYFRDSGITEITISTNGGYNSIEWWQKLASIDIVKVEFSVDGHRNTNHLYRRNVVWNVVERNMKAYSDAGGSGKWLYIPFSHNDDDLGLAHAHAARLGFEFVIKNSGRNQIHEGRKYSVNVKNNAMQRVTVLPSKKIQPPEVSTAKALKSSSLKNISADKIKDAVDTIRCKHYRFNELFIASNQTLWPCCFLYDEYLGKKNIPFNHDYEEGWNSLYHYSIEEIIEHPGFQSLYKIWEPSYEYFSLRCIKTCGKNGQAQNKYKKI